MTVALIVAAASNGVIGKDNQMPWHISEDLKYFKAVTLGKPVIMGRKTFESIGKPLPGRSNIVVTRQPDWQAEGVIRCSSLDEALIQGETVAAENNVDEVMIIGGAQLYHASLDRADRLYLTEIHKNVTGDAYFPSVEKSQWCEVSRKEGELSPVGNLSYSFVVYNRVTKSN